MEQNTSSKSNVLFPLTILVKEKKIETLHYTNDPDDNKISSLVENTEQENAICFITI